MVVRTGARSANIFLHTHMRSYFLAQGIQAPLSKFVKYHDVKGTLSSLHYPLLQSCGRAPRNLT